MKQGRISIRSIIKDVKEKKTDEQIMTRTGMTAKTLRNLKKALIERGLLTVQEVEAQTGGKFARQKVVEADAFAADFRANPDDRFLMEKYGLKRKHLQKVYDRLVDEGVLSEYELHSRTNKVFELDDPGEAPLAASAMVDMTERPPSVSASSLWKVSPGEMDLPSDFFRDQTKAKPASESKPSGAAGEYAASTVVDVVNKKECPNCGHLIDPYFSTDACPKCGIVMAKAKKKLSGSMDRFDKKKPGK